MIDAQLPTKHETRNTNIENAFQDLAKKNNPMVLK